ncbi:MAG: hypothetical protein A3F11_04640 [Gammaproteobacteria bacterium RIFCSPHIGHO2_12_FULL_37_14]|nr:MAG: hypothetical protein A3F11_04640 [Gammaproteobacteria bacterium RIFCSPHIGHO2_12_FULL_37_14]
MNKKKQLKQNRTSLVTYRWIVTMSVLILIVFGGGVFVFYESIQFKLSVPLATSFIQIKSWLLTHKSNNKNERKSKTIAGDQQDIPIPIRFEFYTTLPAMRIANPPETIQKVAENLQQKTAIVVNTHELEQSLLAAINQDLYIVQLKTFQNTSLAMRYQKKLLKLGYKAKVVKIILSQKIAYRVQLGPFLNKEQANTLLFRLQKAGYDGMVQKS